MKALITDILPGNVHAATTFINDMGAAEAVVSIDYDGGGYSTVVFCVERRDAKAFLCRIQKWRSTTGRYKALYEAWAAGDETAKPTDFPDVPPEPLYVPRSWK